MMKSWQPNGTPESTEDASMGLASHGVNPILTQVIQMLLDFTFKRLDKVFLDSNWQPVVQFGSARLSATSLRNNLSPYSQSGTKH